MLRPVLACYPKQQAGPPRLWRAGIGLYREETVMKKLAAGVILVLLGSVPVAAMPYPVHIPIQQDVFVRKTSPDTNYGTGQPGLGG